MIEQIKEKIKMKEEFEIAKSLLKPKIEPLVNPKILAFFDSVEKKFNLNKDISIIQKFKKERFQNSLLNWKKTDSNFNKLIEAARKSGNPRMFLLDMIAKIDHKFNKVLDLAKFRFNIIKFNERKQGLKNRELRKKLFIKKKAIILYYLNFY